MAVEDHPMFVEWKKALENMLAAKEAFKSGTASEADVEAAVRAYCEIADKV